MIGKSYFVHEAMKLRWDTDGGGQGGRRASFWRSEKGKSSETWYQVVQESLRRGSLDVFCPGSLDGGQCHQQERSGGRGGSFRRTRQKVRGPQGSDEAGFIDFSADNLVLFAFALLHGGKFKGSLKGL